MKRNDARCLKSTLREKGLKGAREGLADAPPSKPRIES